MQRVKHIFMMTWFLFIAGIVSVFGQLKFHVASFGEDQFDLAARDERFKKIDGSGSLYAIIKVSGDDLKEYNFNFGNMNHLVESHEDQLWVYVQKNAKQVTITRSGYTPLRNYDLRTTIEAGKTYVMRLSAQGPVIYTQMVLFQVKPAISGAIVLVCKEGDVNAPDDVFGTTDASGNIAKSMEYGTYTYRVMAENYYPSEGRFTLNNQNETHRENVVLRSNGANVTLSVDADADIYVNNAKKGTRSWTGSLKAGNYQVECRQANHRSSSQNITVTEGKDETVTLTPPTPITGVLALSSSPINANIKIDGKDYGTTPRNITDLLIGQHTVTLSLNGYNDAQSTIEIKEQQTTDLSFILTEGLNKSETPVTTSLPKENRTFTVNGVSFEMVFVEGGTFQMGATPEQGGDAKSYEKPVLATSIKSFFIGQTEVTQELWEAVMGNNPSKFKQSTGRSVLMGVFGVAGAAMSSQSNNKKRPVESVAWGDCMVFITKLNQLTGIEFRLPKEAEWEFAARGGNKSQGYKYSGSDTLADVAWYKGNSSKKTHEVATKQPNELGLYDMSGNVVEWCQDWAMSYSDYNQDNSTYSSSDPFRIIRGGSWNSAASSCRVSSRDGGVPESNDKEFGLRLALSE